MGYRILLLMRIILATAAAANHSSCTTNTNAATAASTTAAGIAAAHARSRIIVESLAHLAVTIVASAYAELGEEPDASAIEQIAAEVYKEGEDYCACGHNDGFARLGPVHHGVDGSLIFPASTNEATFDLAIDLRNSPVCAAGQEVNARKNGVGQSNACGKVGVAHFNRMSHNRQINEHYNRIEHMHHNVQGVDLVMFCENRRVQYEGLETEGTCIYIVYFVLSLGRNLYSKRHLDA